MGFAEKTIVPVGKTQDEIRKTLQKYKATGFGFGEFNDNGVVTFDMAGRRIRFVVPIPKMTVKYPTQADHKRHEQSVRTRWRCLLLAIKAKLECVGTGITTLEQEFMAHIVLPNGSTVGEYVTPQIEKAYQDSEMPPMLGYRGPQ